MHWADVLASEMACQPQVPSFQVLFSSRMPHRFVKILVLYLMQGPARKSEGVVQPTRCPAGGVPRPGSPGGARGPVSSHWRRIVISSSYAGLSDDLAAARPQVEAGVPAARGLRRALRVPVGRAGRDCCARQLRRQQHQLFKQQHHQRQWQRREWQQRRGRRIAGRRQP